MKNGTAEIIQSVRSLTIPEIVGNDGVFCDGDWVESKDQDPDGDVRLIQLADIGDGKYLDKSKRFLTTETAKRLRCTYLEPGDILIARMPDPLGRACIFPGDDKPCVTVVDVCIIRPGKVSNVNPVWLMWAINAPELRSKISSLQSGTTRKRISRTNLGSLTLQVPPRKDQDFIVDALESALSKLEAGSASLVAGQRKLNKLRASTLKAACEGKLVPTESELAKREKRDFESTSDLHNRILAERRRRWEESQLADFKAKGKMPKDNKWKAKYKEPKIPDTSDLPELPEGWCWAPINTFAFVTKLAGFEFTKFVKYVPNGDLPVIKAENVSKRGFRPTNFSTVQSGAVQHLNRSKIYPGDVLMVFVGAGLGQVATVPEGTSFFLGPNVALIRPNPEIILPKYLEYFLRSPTGFKNTFGKSSATAQGSISMGKIREVLCAVPPLHVQRGLIYYIESALSRADSLDLVFEHQINRSKSLRASLLRTAMSGNLPAFSSGIITALGAKQKVEVRA